MNNANNLIQLKYLILVYRISTQDNLRNYLWYNLILPNHVYIKINKLQLGAKNK